MASIRQTLLSLKGFGPEKFVVVDILTAFEERKKTALFNPSDQNTLFSEIVSEAEAESQQTMEGTLITNIGGFYKAIDPSLEKTILLVQTWIWWDLPDAIDLYLLDLQAERIVALAKTERTPELLAFYRGEINDPTAELSMADIVELEMNRSRKVGQGFITRREIDPGYKLIVKRDVRRDDALGAHVQDLAQRLRIIEQTRQGEAMAPMLCEHYAKLLHCPAEDVTPERVQGHETAIVAAACSRLHAMLGSQQMLGEPYDFKHRQIELVRQKVAMSEASAQAAAGREAAPA
jgi:hypothetical protein